MEERRLLLAVALSLLVLTAYQILFPPAPPPPTAKTAATAPTTIPHATTAPPSAPEPEKPAARPKVGDDQERRVEVEGRYMSVALTNKGARMLSWQLRDFRDARGRPEDMVETAPGAVRPLDLETADPILDARLRDAIYLPSQTTLQLSGNQPSELRFEYSDGEIEASKTLRFVAEGYLVGIEAAVRRQGVPVPVRVLWGPGIGNPTAAEREIRGYIGPQAVVSSRGSVTRHPGKEITQPQPFGEVAFAGVESHYFAAVWVPSASTATAEIRGVSLPGPDGAAARMEPVAAVPTGAGAPVFLYVGPKDYHTLKAAGHGLERVVPVGDWIGSLVVRLLDLLRFVHRFIGNYGWSIVALTVVINAALAPLRHYSIKNGIKMAKLSPEMRVIQDRYRKLSIQDPKRQQMQDEIQALYARHGMSMGTQMAVGCLPVLLTMPFLFAFYRVLEVSVDLRGASFLWIPDLSQKDPLFLTPLLMGASMVVMQKMTPSAMDPAQQRMMMLMPLVLMGMFFWAPSGLNLYWLASNVCSIAQQGVTLQIMKHEERRQPREKDRA
jgi:YidC/Oxa1 family membrane protein insertase